MGVWGFVSRRKLDRKEEAKTVVMGRHRLSVDQ